MVAPSSRVFGAEYCGSWTPRYALPSERSAGRQPLLVENDSDLIRARGPRDYVRLVVHHASDPLVQDPQPPTRPVLSAQGVI